MTESEMKNRFRTFALRVLKLCDALPNTPVGRAISGQLTRSGTSPGANYRAACRAKSRPDFVNKLAIVEEEIDESAYWLDMIIASELIPAKRVQSLLTEAEELTKIVTSSRMTAKHALYRKDASSHDRPRA